MQIISDFFHSQTNLFAQEYLVDVASHKTFLKTSKTSPILNNSGHVPMCIYDFALGHTRRSFHFEQLCGKIRIFSGFYMLCRFLFFNNKQQYCISYIRMLNLSRSYNGQTIIYVIRYVVGFKFTTFYTVVCRCLQTIF